MNNKQNIIEAKKQILTKPQLLKDEIKQLKLIVEEYTKLSKNCDNAEYSNKWLKQAQEAEERLKEKEHEYKSI